MMFRSCISFELHLIQPFIDETNDNQKRNLRAINRQLALSIYCKMIGKVHPHKMDTSTTWPICYRQLYFSRLNKSQYRITYVREFEWQFQE